MDADNAALERERLIRAQRRRVFTLVGLLLMLFVVLEMENEAAAAMGHEPRTDPVRVVLTSGRRMRAACAPAGGRISRGLARMTDARQAYAAGSRREAGRRLRSVASPAALAG